MLYQCFIQEFNLLERDYLYIIEVLQLFKGNSAVRVNFLNYMDIDGEISLKEQFTFSWYFIATFSSVFSVYITNIMLL